MVQETGLIANLTVSLAFALLGGFLASRLGLPPIVGYLLAGVAVGPHTPGFIADPEIADQLADIGVILLMFGVGIHFSLRDLLAVRTVAVSGAVAQMAVLGGLGAAVASWWGWSPGEGLILGLAISWASLVRTLVGMDALDSVHGRIAVGWLVVEDLFAVTALVLLPPIALALGGTTPAPLPAAGREVVPAIVLTLGKVAVLAVLLLFVGKRAVPWLLAQVARAGSRELFTLAVLAVALGIAFGSSALFGVPLALGAFLAGLVVSESDLSHQVAADALPLRDAFAVLFFVSIGMLANPAALVDIPGAMLAVLAMILLAKPVSALLVMFAFGYPPRASLIVAAGRAQIGEFSFIHPGRPRAQAEPAAGGGLPPRHRRRPPLHHPQPLPLPGH